MKRQSGWERDFRTHFDDIVPAYERARPEWPDAIFDDIMGYLTPSGEKRALEIGPGTGKATAPILRRGFNVTAVEISERMTEYLHKRFQTHDDFRVITSAFEDALLEENAFDLVYAASAFHWVNAEIGCPKVHRLLRNGGTFALFRYNEIASPDDPIYRKIRAAHHAYYDAYYRRPECPAIRKTHADFTGPDEIERGFRFRRLEDYGFQDVTMRFYDVTITYDAAEYTAFLDTLSDHRNLPESVRAPYYDEVKRIIDKNDGVYRGDYVFELYMGRK